MIKYCLLILLLPLHGIVPVNTKSFPTAVSSPTDPFLMPVEDVFSISGRGTVVTGKILRGMVKMGDSIDIVGINDRVMRTKVKGIEMFRKMPTEAKEGDKCGLILANFGVLELKRGMVAAKPGSMYPYRKFTCEVILKTKEEGGRTLPVADNFRAQFLIYNTLFTGVIKLPKGMQNIKPAEKTMVTVEMETPVAVEKDITFSIVSGKEIGSGIITGVIKN